MHFKSFNKINFYFIRDLLRCKVLNLLAVSFKLKIIKILLSEFLIVIDSKSLIKYINFYTK